MRASVTAHSLKLSWAIEVFYHAPTSPLTITDYNLANRQCNLFLHKGHSQDCELVNRQKMMNEEWEIERDNGFLAQAAILEIEQSLCFHY